MAKESTREGYQRIVEEIRDTHLAIVRAALSDDTQYARVEAELRHECAQLTVFLEAAQVIGEMSTRSLDAVIGVGEKLACRVFVAVLRSLVRQHAPAARVRMPPRALLGSTSDCGPRCTDRQGVKAVMVNLCKVIERAHDEKHLNADFYAYLRTAIVQRVQETRDANGGDHIIPVVTGTPSRSTPSPNVDPPPGPSSSNPAPLPNHNPRPGRAQHHPHPAPCV